MDKSYNNKAPNPLFSSSYLFYNVLIDTLIINIEVKLKNSYLLLSK